MCDVLVALGSATDSGRTLFAKNSDRPPSERQVLEFVAPRVEASTVTTHGEIPAHHRATVPCFISRPAWGWGAEHGVNEHGVALGNTTVYTTLDPRGCAPGLTGMDLVRLALERCTTASDAVDLVLALIGRFGQGGSGHDPAAGRDRPYWNAFLVADPTSAFVIDTSGNEWSAVEQVTSVRAISNRTSVPGFDEVHRHPRQPVERLVDPRWRASQAVLAERPVSVGSLTTHLRSHDSAGEPGWSVCMHAGEVEATTSSMVADLAPSGGSVIRALIGSPCATDYVTVPFAEAAAVDWARSFGVA